MLQILFVVCTLFAVGLGSLPFWLRKPARKSHILDRYTAAPDAKDREVHVTLVTLDGEKHTYACDARLSLHFAQDLLRASARALVPHDGGDTP